jgi:RNA polymerase sigma-70 factor (ECF subfamily)
VDGFKKRFFFENYINEYGPPLSFLLFFSFTNNYFDAEDLAQDTFLSAYNTMNRFDGKNLKAYLTTIATNKCRDYLRRSERKNLPLPEDENAILTGPDECPEKKIIDKESRERVLDACRKLKEPYRKVAIGYFCENEKLSDMAGKTGENLKTLQTRLYRAKSHLRLSGRRIFK